MTVTVPGDDAQEMPRLSIAAGVAVVEAVATLALTEEVVDLERRLRLKWPNDVQLEGRKLAGVLVEIVDDVAMIGIGINVAQRAWPASIARSAISLAEAGVAVDRVTVIARALVALHEMLRLDRAELMRRFAHRDGLVGTRRRFRCREHEHVGMVLAIDPFRMILLRADDGTTVELPALHTTLVGESNAPA